MAIYHLTVKTISKEKSASSLARYDYIERKEKYSSGLDEVLFSSAGNMPEWAAKNDREYWVAADKYERQNGRLCKTVEFSLPRELSFEKQKNLVLEFVDKISNVNGINLPYSLVIHKGKGTNPHCHVMLSERINDGLARNAETWFKRAGKTPEKGGARKTDALKSKDWLYWIREEWGRQANLALEQAGHKERIDHRTLSEQGIEREPTLHQGPMVTRLEHAGKPTRIGGINQRIRELNAVIAEQEKDVREERFAEMELAIRKGFSGLGLPMKARNMFIDQAIEHLRNSDDVESDFMEIQKSISLAKEKARELDYGR